MSDRLRTMELRLEVFLIDMNRLWPRLKELDSEAIDIYKEYMEELSPQEGVKLRLFMWRLRELAHEIELWKKEDDK